MIEHCTTIEQPGWLTLRLALWPHSSQQEHLAEMASFIAKPERYVQFVAYSESRLPVGLIEASLRYDYVNGTETSPVAFLEGVYVVTELRRQGIAARLVATVAEWAQSKGCAEFASDTLIDNEVSQTVHQALGFEETERVMFFRKVLDNTIVKSH